jgi:hypothetical protein
VATIGVCDPPAPLSAVAGVMEALVELADRGFREVNDLDRLFGSAHQTFSFSQM